MNWAPITLQWPAAATSWMEQLSDAKGLAVSQLQSTTGRLDSLQSLAHADLSPIGAIADQAAAIGRSALSGQFGEIPACVVVTPFQSGVGQGQGYQRFLSAPNLLQRLADKLKDDSDPSRPAGEQYALAVLFLGTRFDELSGVLGRFNALLPIGDLQRAQRRAMNVFNLDAEKWELPAAGTLPRWGGLPLERCTVLKEASQAMTAQVATLESYAANSSPLDDLAALAQRKAEQANAQADRLQALQDSLTGGSPDGGVQARLLGPGDPTELRKQLLEDADAPGHEWPLSCGLLLVGSLASLSFVRELVGL